MAEMCKMLEDMRNEAARTAAYEADRATAKRMLRDGSMPLDKIVLFVPSISMDELKKIEAEIMQPT